MPYSRKIVYLTEEQRNTLVAEGSITVGGVTVIYNENDIYLTPQDEPLTDVQVNGTSVVSSGVANVPITSSSAFGVAKIDETYGVSIRDDGKLRTVLAQNGDCKGGSNTYKPITPYSQHNAVFYGLSKVAGVDLYNTTVTLGTYPETSKVAIKSMLGITDPQVTDVQVAGTSVVSGGVANVPVAGNNFGVVRVRTGTERPSTSMVADYIGQLYLNTGSNQKGFYICTDINNGVYTWRRIMITNDSIGAINLLGVDSAGEEVSVVIGKGAGRNYQTLSVCVGAYSEAVTYGIALGYYAKALAAGVSGKSTIQIGQGTNNATGTMQVNSFRMLEADGTIPPERITANTWTEVQKAGVRSTIGVESGISLVETVSGTTPTITGQPNVRYMCSEVSTLDITPPASGTIDVIFTSGSTATVLTVPSTVKFPSWFDATALDADTVYEIMITDGVYGAVMTWAN